MNKYDVIIILGHSVSKKGVLSKEQILRLDKGIELLKEGIGKNLLMTGGFGKHFNQTNKSLAEHMKQYALQNDIEDNRIFIEEKSFDTIENIKFSEIIIKENSWKSILIVSSRHHIRRTKMIVNHIWNDKYQTSYNGVLTPLSKLPSRKKMEDIHYENNKKMLETIYIK
ncbi:YdcF family protein [Patescibacteria group bacterium]